MTNRSEKLKQLIDERFNGSQVDFAKKIKKGEPQVHQWLTGFRNMSDRSARAIEDAVGLDVGWFEEFYLGAKSQERDRQKSSELLPPEDAKLLKLFRQLNSQAKNEVISFVEFKVNDLSESRDPAVSKTRKAS